MGTLDTATAARDTAQAAYDVSIADGAPSGLGGTWAGSMADLEAGIATLRSGLGADVTVAGTSWARSTLEEQNRSLTLLMGEHQARTGDIVRRINETNAAQGTVDTLTAQLAATRSNAAILAARLAHIAIFLTPSPPAFPDGRHLTATQVYGRKREGLDALAAHDGCISTEAALTSSTTLTSLHGTYDSVLAGASYA